jgi:hypothetical protein
MLESTLFLHQTVSGQVIFTCAETVLFLVFSRKRFSTGHFACAETAGAEIGASQRNHCTYTDKTSVQGVANATNMKLGEIVLYNLFYEISSACTAVIARDANDKIVHGRNLDFGETLQRF